jgi:hypothetical protein
MLIRRGQNGVQSKPGTRPWRTYSRGATRRPLFKYVHWLLCIVVLYLHVLTIMIRLFVYSVFDSLSQPFLLVGNLICNTNWCLFSQVKNKPWYTWVYTWFWQRREHLVLLVSFILSPLNFIRLCSCLCTFFSCVAPWLGTLFPRAAIKNSPS